MLVKEKTTGELYITDGRPLTLEQAKEADITGSFMTLVHKDTGAEKLYIWPYYADLAYEIVDPDYVMAKLEPTLYPEIEAADLMNARNVAEEMGRVAGEARFNILTGEQSDDRTTDPK